MVEGLPKEAFETMATKQVRKAAPSYSLISDQKFQQMYAAMATLRRSAKRNAASRGAEAPIVATLIDLRPGDLIIAPTHLLPDALLNDERLQFKPVKRAGAQILGIPVVASPSAGSVPAIAAGAALGRNTAANDSVIVAFGITDTVSRESWLEALRLTGRYKLPILFVLLQGDAEDAAFLGSQAMTAGVISVPVDSADVVAMYRVASESLARARRRTGATMIVSTPYKLEDEQSRRAEDPLKKLETYLRKKGISLKLP